MPDYLLSNFGQTEYMLSRETFISITYAKLNIFRREPQKNNPNARTVVRPFYRSSERCIVRSNARTIERTTERRIERDYASLFLCAYIACI
jgi:hypothetical protein